MRAFTIKVTVPDAYEHMTDKQIMQMIVSPYHAMLFETRVRPAEGYDKKVLVKSEFPGGRPPSDPED
jgi:hypothetical protein